MIFLAILLAANLRLVAADLAATATVLEGKVLCVRVAQLTEKFASQFPSFMLTNPVTGLILDLRFAAGDEATVMAAKEIFAAKKLPLVILVNAQTRDGALDLALRLRGEKLAVVIGSTNRIGKLSPDIAVESSAADEKFFLENPFATPTTNGVLSTAAKNELLPFVDHMTEAELVHRKIKDGEDPGDEVLSPRSVPPQPVIRDPALARAVDLLKALTILQPARG